MEHLTKLLDQLAEAQAQQDLLRMDYAAMRARIMAPVQAEIAALDAEMLPKQQQIGQRIAELEAAVKAGVMAHGATVKGARLQAVYMKGRESWDTSKLGGYAAAHPEILQFRTFGQPSVSIRVNGGK